MDWQNVIRKLLEMFGFVERRDTAVRRRLATINQAKPRGPVTLILEDLGPKKISALTAVRKVTGLNLDEALVLAEEMLPVPILVNVDQVTAELAVDILKAMGIKISLVGAKITPEPQKIEKPFPPPLFPSLEPIVDSAKEESSEAEGEFVVILQDASLLPERIAKIVQALTGWNQEETEITLAKLPQPILIGVREEMAHRAQQEMQMLGAVVDVLRWEAYDAAS